ncbi:hypothetical protein HLK59_15900, partial [Streptomyces sp. S3(2020)]|uniref:hypothetical protein n=1 Tax=Streptomyces sp. S3(2020) TaxID=2732044 RepID=UPI0017EC8A2F
MPMVCGKQPAQMPMARLRPPAPTPTAHGRPPAPARQIRPPGRAEQQHVLGHTDVNRSGAHEVPADAGEQLLQALM